MPNRLTSGSTLSSGNAKRLKPKHRIRKSHNFRRAKCQVHTILILDSIPTRVTQGRNLKLLSNTSIVSQTCLIPYLRPIECTTDQECITIVGEYDAPPSAGSCWSGGGKAVADMKVDAEPELPVELVDFESEDCQDHHWLNH